jgi:hypothetical protein
LDRADADMTAIVDDFSTREEPGGVLLRTIDDEGREDEAFTTNLIVARIRRTVTG